MNNRTMKPLVWDEGTAEIKALWHGDRYVTIATVCVPAWHEDAVCGAREAGANAAYLVEAWNSHASQASRIAELEQALRGILSAETHDLHVGYDSGSGGGNYVYADVVRTDDEAFIAARKILGNTP